MLSKKIAFLLVPVIISSCGVTTGNIANSNEQNNVSNNKIINTSTGTLRFNKITNDKLAEYNNLLNRNLSSAPNISSNINSRNNVSDSIVSSNSSTSSVAPSIGAESKMTIAPSADIAMRYFPPYYGGFWEDYTVIDFEEAKQEGFSGTYLEALNKIVKPIISQLAPDIRLVNTSGNSDVEGNNKISEETKKIMPYMDYYQWYFNFVSSSQKEVYSINISQKEVLVLRQKWGLKKLDFENIKIDSKDAIKIFSDAIKNKDLKSTDNQEQYLPKDGEIIYEIPENTSWYFYLENDKSNLIWSLSMNINYNYPIPLESTVSSSGTTSAVEARPYTPPSYWYSGGYARIDATTGKILSFTRPVRYKNNADPYPKETVPPMPPIPKESPSALPEPVVTSSPENKY
ncbi:MAG: hypothetical protein KatS3mg068_1453 [Candidatus Sericytochromatia bacterium]|nr:MAG: hypothetical protein KatS3mg068_1453 [Candidatus Sericytochromatia bacterium]